MARHQNMNWSLPEGTPDGRGGRTHQWETIKVALLMDLRHELQQINTWLRQINNTLQCPNALAIPRILRRISSNTAKKRKKRIQDDVQR